jgi:hypothetical protein
MLTWHHPRVSLPEIMQGADFGFDADFCLLFIRPVHQEVQPHKWSVSWTTFRDNSIEHMGGHFYVADYGIRIQAASNKAVFWKPGDWHGTSLPMLKPGEKGGPLLQSGLAIVTSPRLPDAFAAFHEGKLTPEAMWQEASKSNEIGLEDIFEDIAL